MKTNRQTAVREGDRHMTTSGQTAVINGDKHPHTKASKLIRWAGLSAMVAGIIFAGIQPIHPPDVLASVTTGAWAIIAPLKFAMCLLFLLGIAGLYARQVEEAGWLGVAGFLLFSLCWWIQTGFVFAEVFILPLLPTDAPQFVGSFLGLASGDAGEVNLGALAAAWTLMGVLYLLGGLLFGIATLRAGILPRWPAGLLAVTAAVTPAAALLPHEIQRLAAVPMGVALAWLGYALWSERREQAAQPVPGRGSPQIRQTAAE